MWVAYLFRPNIWIREILGRIFLSLSYLSHELGDYSLQRVPLYLLLAVLDYDCFWHWQHDVLLSISVRNRFQFQSRLIRWCKSTDYRLHFFSILIWKYVLKKYKHRTVMPSSQIIHFIREQYLATSNFFSLIPMNPF